jgi:hypothetical protein
VLAFKCWPPGPGQGVIPARAIGREGVHHAPGIGQQLYAKLPLLRRNRESAANGAEQNESGQHGLSWIIAFACADASPIQRRRR